MWEEFDFSHFFCIFVYNKQTKSNKNMIEQLEKKIKEANDAYRAGGDVIMTDSQYDQLLEELELLDPHNELLQKVGHVIVDETRKSKLPIPMASMNKEKTLAALQSWCGKKGISNREEVIITPKFDGLSLCVHEVNTGSWDNLNFDAWTRGDGTVGQKSNPHYDLIENKLKKNRNRYDDGTFSSNIFEYTYGEVMIPKQVFIDKFAKDYANPRNLVAGLLNSKTPDTMLKDCQFIKYGATMSDKFKNHFTTKKEVLDQLNTNQKMGVQYLVCTISELSEEMLIALFKTWSDTFEIDGLIIELNDLKRQDELGRETSSNNPVWARAFKHSSFEQSAVTDVLGVSWNISKQGYLKPIIHIRPVKLDGVTISNVTGNNARFVKDLGIGFGAKVLVKRSGMVIPTIADVIEPVEWKDPVILNTDIKWNDNGVELMTVGETDQQRFKQTVSFFEILGVENVGEGVIRQLWDAGFNSVEKILRITPGDMHNLPGFGTRKSMIVHTAIFNKTREVELCKLQHATGLFKNLGSKKLRLLEHLNESSSVDEIVKLEGFAETSAKAYLSAIKEYNTFYKSIKDVVSLKVKVEAEDTTDELIGMSFVFSGVRRNDLNEIILSKGGKIASGVSKNSTHLVMKATGTGSAKETKALGLGQEIITVNELEEMLAC